MDISTADNSVVEAIVEFGRGNNLWCGPPSELYDCIKTSSSLRDNLPANSKVLSQIIKSNNDVFVKHGLRITSGRGRYRGNKVGRYIKLESEGPVSMGQMASLKACDALDNVANN